MPELGRAVELVETRPEVGDHLLLHAHRARRRRHHDRAHGRHVVARPHRGGQVDDALQERRRHERAAAAVALDGGERGLGVELRHDDHGAAEEVRVQGEAAGRRVIERARHEVDVRGIGHVERGEPRQEPAGIRPAPPRALGLAGGPRGVDGGRSEHLAAGQLPPARSGPPRRGRRRGRPSRGAQPRAGSRRAPWAIGRGRRPPWARRRRPRTPPRPPSCRGCRRPRRR